MNIDFMSSNNDFSDYCITVEKRDGSKLLKQEIDFICKKLHLKQINANFLNNSDKNRLTILDDNLDLNVNGHFNNGKDIFTLS